MCGKTQLSTGAVLLASYSPHVTAMAILFAYNASCHTIARRDRKVSAEGSMDEVERDAHYANEQTEDDDDEVSRWGR